MPTAWRSTVELIASYRPEPRDLEPFITEARRMRACGEELERVWAYLRENGIDLSDSITVTVEITGVARREAKQMVCHSQTWSDMFPAIVQLHDSVEQALNEIATEEPGVISTHAESAR
jgi:hypothetical protein